VVVMVVVVGVRGFGIIIIAVIVVLTVVGRTPRLVDCRGVHVLGCIDNDFRVRGETGKARFERPQARHGSMARKPSAWAQRCILELRAPIFAPDNCCRGLVELELAAALGMATNTRVANGTLVAVVAVNESVGTGDECQAQDEACHASRLNALSSVTSNCNALVRESLDLPEKSGCAVPSLASPATSTAMARGAGHRRFFGR
jgi:hypothetical protein